MDLLLGGKIYELVLGGLISFAFAGWNLFLHAEKRKIVEDIKLLLSWREKFTEEQTRSWLSAAQTFATKNETVGIETKLMQHLDRIEQKLDALLLKDK